MKKLLILAALIMMICGAAEAQNAYKYTEPKDSIVRIFWNEIKQLPAITKAEAYDKALYDKAVQFHSKTEMSFDFVRNNVDTTYQYDIFAKMKMRCYQMLDGGWVAVLDIDFHGKQLSEQDAYDKIAVATYQKGKMSYPKLTKFFPSMEALELIANNRDNFFEDHNVVFGDSEITYSSYEFLPLRFVWNGKTFENTSKIICQSVLLGGHFAYCYPKDDDAQSLYFPPMIGDDTFFNMSLDDKNYYVYNKKKLAKFDVKDGIVEGYTLLDPTCGIIQDRDSNGYAFGNPVAIGLPISAYKGKCWIEKNSPLNKEFKNGKYVVNQLINHDTKFLKRDVFIELTAKDENSPIETIRVYSKPLIVTLQSEIDSDTSLSNDAKTIFKALNFNDKDYGTFDNVWCYKNGMDIQYKPAESNPDVYVWGDGVKVNYFIYKADGKYLVVLAKIDKNNNICESKFWYYENGTLTPTDYKIPAPTLGGGVNSTYDFDAKGLHYYHSSDSIFSDEDFIWNGKEFVKE